VALTAKGALPNATFGNAPKLMVWLSCVTVKLWLTAGAAEKFPFPACVAWIVQGPAETSVTVDPDTVHTAVVCELKLTANPEVAVALTVNAAVPYTLFANAPKLMV